MADRPYYFTWSDQANAEFLKIKNLTDHEFILEGGASLADLSSISFQCSFGHRPAEIIASVKKQLNLFPVMPAKAVYPEKDDLSHQLIDLINLDGGKIFYTVSGAEAVENAAKMARTTSRRQFIACRNNSYHGASSGALSLTGDWRNKQSHIVDERVIRIPEPSDDPNLEETEKLLIKFGPHNVAAFCLETVSGINGVIDPSPQWWQGIQTLCEKYKIILILDEVICGFYRTGPAFGLHRHDLKPDIVCMAKAISGGVVPFGAIWTSSKIAHYYQHKKLVAGLTNYAHPLGLAALSGVLQLTSKESFQLILEKNIQTLKIFLDQVRPLNFVTKCRQVGMLAAIEAKPATRLSWKYFIDKGLYVSINTNNSLILAPALNFTPELLENSLNTLFTALRELDK